jgi:predicted nuclease with TOPRIM domain
VELQRMNSENKKLKEMLNHVTGNYTALQMQLVALMQKNHHTENEVINYKLSLVYFNLKYEFIINVSVQE